MVEERFNIALEDCISRLAEGESLAEIVQRYPEFAADLRALLESGLIVRDIQATDDEVAISQQRVAERFEAALSTPVTMRTNQSWWRGLSLAAASIAIFLFANVAFAQGSLPGDWNYGIKRFSESTVILVTGNEEQFADRRINETQQLLSAGQEADVVFAGEVIAINEADFQIAQLNQIIEASPDLLASLRLNQQIRITARTTADSRIIAGEIEILRDIESDENLRPSPSPEITESVRDTATHTATVRPTETDTPVGRPSLTWTPTVTPSATVTDTPSSTATILRTATPEIRPTQTPLQDANAGDSQSACTVSIPAGWIAYTIQPGDALFDLAIRSGGSLESIVQANCIDDPALVSVGQTVYFPNPVETQPTQAATTMPTNTEASRPDNPPQATRQPVRPTATQTRNSR